jgi:hypothetical protein
VRRRASPISRALLDLSSLLLHFVLCDGQCISQIYCLGFSSAASSGHSFGVGLQIGGARLRCLDRFGDCIGCLVDARAHDRWMNSDLWCDNNRVWVLAFIQQR